MRRILTTAAAIAMVAIFWPTDAFAHGGSFRGPNGGVPPGLREPSDPEPPPPPPSDPGTPGGPTTPSGPSGPTTPTPEGGHETPGDSAPPAPIGPSQGPKKRATTKSLTFESWRFWWAYNNDDILNLKTHIYAERVSSSSPLHFASRQDEENRRNAQRPTERAVKKTIIPALMRSLNRKSDHEDIHGGALIALGKIGTSRYINLFYEATFDKYKNDRGMSIEFGSQARESAVLALGVLPNQDEASKEAIRRICLEVIDYEGSINIRSRERAWAGVVLGLQRDEGAVRPLIERLGKKYSDDNVPAGLLCGLGLIGSKEPLGGLHEAFLKGDLFGRKVTSDRILAFVGYAIAKIGDPESLKTVLMALNSRRTGRVVKRSAAIAAGILGAKTADDDMKDKAVNTLLKYIRKSGGDGSGENFAIIALSQIGTERALNALIDIAESGKYGQRPFAGLGLATHIFYRDRDAAEKKAEPMNPDLRKKIVEKLIKLSGKYKDADTKSAFMLCRGLVKDRTAVDELVGIAAKRSADPTLRGFSCVALGLIGDASDSVKDAMKLALRERKSTDLRRDAATGLGLLRDAEVVKLLLGELEKAKSFAVQGQLIQAIGTIGDHTAIEPLVEILDNKSEPSQTRAMAAVGLGMIGDLRELPALARLSKNYNYRASVPDLDELLFIL
jgi:HEAT repeat protein